MDNIGIGIQLMVVGMTTVFLILLVVIYGGKMLINVVNKIAPEETVPAKKTAVAPTAIDASTMSVLQEVVKQITGGKGYVKDAKKI